ncbi:hypothetical protein BGW38_006527 [Lunasporangiospora selenospora]|uniref:Uncharacterized protein n=1 Tax=Lunasporangiospora selenospora TaxID=979761 RepID=A0A9P6KAW5_9FUNG|nr:hypothetical protein BGW38_006527 [Lunasporangiospora selenospora]
MERLLDLLLCTLSAGPDQWIPWHLYDFFVKPQGQKYNDLVELLPTQSQKIIRAIMETVDAFLDYEVSVVQQQHRIQPPTQPQPPQLPPQQTTKAFLAGVMTSNNSGAVSGGTLPSTLALAKRSVAAQSHLRSKSDIYGPPRAVAAAMPVGTAAPHFNRPPLTESRNHHGGNLGNGDRIHEDIAIRARKRRSLLDTLAPLVFRPRQDSSGIHGSAHSYFDRPLQGQGSLSGYSSRTLPHRPTIQHLPPTSSIQGSTQATTDGLLPMNDRVRKRNSIAAGMSLSLSSSPMTNMTPTASGTVGTGSAIMMVGSQQTPMATAPGAVAMGREQEREAGIRAFENLVSAFEEEYHAHKPSLGVGSSPLTLDSQRSIHGVLGIVGVSTPDLRTTASTTPGLSGATSHGPGVGRYNSVMSSTLPPLPNRPSRSMPDAMAISRATTSGIADSDEVDGGRIGVRPKIRPAMVPRTRSKSESREKSHCSTSSSSSSNDGPSSIAEREAAVEAIARARALKRNSLPYGRSMARLSSSWTVWEDHVLVVEEEEIVIKDTSDEDSIAGGREKRQQQQQKPLSFQPTPAPQLPAAPVAHHIQWSRGRMEERQVQTVVESLQHSSTQPTKSDSPSTAQRDGHEGDEGWTFIQGESTLDPLIAKVHGSVGGTQPSSSPTEKASGETLSSTPVSRVKRRQKTISGTFGSLTRLVSSRRGGAGEGSSKGI